MQESDLTIFMQPIFNLHNDSIKYAEVLLRHSDNRLSPVEIVGLFEEQGKTFELDMQILQKACDVINSGFPVNTKITVNLARATLEKTGLCSSIIEVMRRNGVRNNRIIFEIHELTKFEHITVSDNLRAMKEAKIEVAIDDFGKGTTTVPDIIVSNTRLLKFDGLNIELENNYTEEKFLDNLDILGIDTVVERIETLEQLEKARMLGYKNAQGYYLSTPLSVEDYFRKFVGEGYFRQCV